MDRFIVRSAEARQLTSQNATHRIIPIKKMTRLIAYAPK
jgi:hypothetical protein